MTDQQQGDDDINWGASADGEGVPDLAAVFAPSGKAPTPSPAPGFPEFPDNPHEHRVVATIKGGSGYDAPWVVVHANTASEIIAHLNELDAYGFYPALLAAQERLRSVAPSKPAAPASPAPMAYGPPAQAPQPPNQGPPFGPNVSVPSAPGYAGPPVAGPPQQQWNQPVMPQQNWGGGGYNAGGNTKPDPSPQPPGWWRINGRSGPGFDAWKALREQNKDYVKGKIKWAGGSDYWIDPSIGPWLGQQGYAVSQ